MADSGGAGYLSIGEVLGLLLEEFPDVTISKIRFLESQGLIEPERTASGYRKFYDHDVQLLRVILAEQKDNFLPLRVIRDRLENGQIDPTGENQRPASEGGDPDDGTAETTADTATDTAADTAADTVAAPEVPAASMSSHPAAGAGGTPDADQHATDAIDSATPEPEPDEGANPPQLLPGVALTRDELCALVGMTDSEIDDLESFGIVHRRDGGGPPTYGDDAVEIARPAVAFMRAGVDARHLRTFRTSAEREVSLYEQLVTPRLRQRNPDSVAAAKRQLHDLDELGATLRSALIRHALHHPFDR